VVARRGHAILDVAAPGLERLARERWVMQQRDSSVRRAFVETFVREGLLPPDPLVETGTYLQNLAIVAQSDLLSVVPRQPAEQYRTFGQVEIVDLRLDVAPAQVSLITRLPLQGNTLVERFAHALEESLKKSAAQRGSAGTALPRTQRALRAGSASRPPRSTVKR
jgi:DNA-binding transcriptional LysR family regulator